MKSWAERYNIPFHLREPTVSLQKKLDQASSIQTVAREWRRSESTAILEALKSSSLNHDHGDGHRGFSGGKGWGYIATAHHNEDQVETLLHKLTRGVHISHICGMQGVEGNFVKPLLTVSKDDLTLYMQSYGYDWREDSSNAARKYKRNTIRLDLVPLLNQLATGGGLKSRLDDMIEQSAEVRELLDTQIERFLNEHEQHINIWNEEIDHPPSNVAEVARNTLLEMDLVKSNFYKLPSIVQKEVLHYLVKRGSGGRVSLVYDSTRRLQSFLFERRGAADKSKTTMPLGNSLFAVHIGDTFRIIGPASEHVYSNSDSDIIEMNEDGNDNTKKRNGNTVGDEIMIMHMDKDTNKRISIANQFPGLIQIYSAGAGNATTITRSSERSEKIERNMCVYNVRLKFPRGIDQGCSDNGDDANVDIGNHFTLRFAMDGDKFLPPWKASPVKVSQFLRGQHVRLEDRSKIPVLVLRSTQHVIAVGDFVSKEFYAGDLQGKEEEENDRIFSLKIIVTQR